MRWPYILPLAFLLAMFGVGWINFRIHVGIFERATGRNLQTIYDRTWDEAGERPQKLDAGLVARVLRGKMDSSMDPRTNGLWVNRRAVTVGSEELFLVTAWPGNEDLFVGVTAGRTVKSLRRGEWAEREFVNVSWVGREDEIDGTTEFTRGVKN